MKGLNKVRLVDAGFVWTEPHSKRIKVSFIMIYSFFFPYHIIHANNECVHNFTGKCMYIPSPTSQKGIFACEFEAGVRI